MCHRLRDGVGQRGLLFVIQQRGDRLPGVRSHAMSDEDDTVTIRAGGSWYRKVLTSEQADELRQLYDELPDTATGAAEALGTTGPVPSGMPLQRFFEHNARVLEMVARIREILG